MLIIRHIIREALPLLATVWVLSTIGCQKLEDHRTPYKSYIIINFKRTSENLPDQIFIHQSNVDLTRNGQEDYSQGQPPIAIRGKQQRIKIRLSPDTGVNTLSLDIVYYSTTAVRTETLTIHYDKKAVLISPQHGCAYRYRITEVQSKGIKKYTIINKELSTSNESEIDLEIHL